MKGGAYHIHKERVAIGLNLELFMHSKDLDENRVSALQRVVSELSTIDVKMKHKQRI